MKESAVGMHDGARRRYRLVLGLPLMAACATAFDPPAPPAAIQAIRLQPTMNHTGKSLRLRGDIVIDRLFHIRRTTVEEALADHAGRLLRRRGFVVLAGADTTSVSMLRFEIERWDEEPQSTPAVTVSIVARLMDPHTQDVLWSAERRDWRIPTLSAPTVSEARAHAVRSVVRALLANWRVPPSP